MVTSVSPAQEGRTISSSPDTTTKNGTDLSPCSTSTSPGWIARICPCTATIFQRFSNIIPTVFQHHSNGFPTSFQRFSNVFSDWSNPGLLPTSSAQRPYLDGVAAVKIKYTLSF